jgi:hypothetical protein
LGESKRTSSKTRGILNLLEFDESMNTEQIISNMNELIKTYFPSISVPALNGLKKALARLANIPFGSLLSLSSSKSSEE